MSSQRANAIVQMFNTPFRDISEELGVLATSGYSHVLVSPPQLSHPSTDWWGRYQPVDFTVIDGPLGNCDDLHQLCSVASNRGVKILVDTVLNHMANHPNWITVNDSGAVVDTHFPRYSMRDFHPPGCNNDRCVWLGGLPDLRTESRYVRDEAKAYITRLVDEFGVGGFRFDAAKHIEPEFFRYILSKARDAFCFGEFVVNHPDAVDQAYLEVMDAYDFPLAATMRKAFGWGGDLRSLLCPARHGNAFSGVSAVTFVRHHDIVQHPDWFADYYIESPEDRRLAYAYILGRREGTPFVFLDDRQDAMVLAGLKFHNSALGKDHHGVAATENQLVIRRGNDQLCVINKAAEGWIIPQVAELRDGDYLDLFNDDTFTVSGGKLVDVPAPGRSARFLVRQNQENGA